jgi:hypothetical protein
LSKLPIENALEWIVEWYQAHYAGDEDMRALTEAQIDQYEMLAAPTSGDAHSVIPQKVKNAQ